MTPAYDAELRRRYPLVFARPLLNDEPIRCGDGWFILLDRFCRDLEALIAREPEPAQHRYHAQQVKEKFGVLRFYLARETAPMTALIQAAEDASGRVCDVCAQPGKLRSGDPDEPMCWVRTRCDEHINWRAPETGFAHQSGETK